MRLIPIVLAVSLVAGAGLAVAQQRPPRDIEDLFSPRQTFPPPKQRPGGVETVPLPPPPAARGNVPEPPPPQKGQAQKGRAAPAPPAEVRAEPPTEQRIVNPTAVFSGLDKITGRIYPFEISMNETVQFGALQVTPRACYTRPPTEPQNTVGFVEVNEITLEGKMRRIFTGWMFAASPGLNAVEHGIYDVWLVDCKQEPPDLGKKS